MIIRPMRRPLLDGRLTQMRVRRNDPIVNLQVPHSWCYSHDNPNALSASHCRNCWPHRIGSCDIKLHNQSNVANRKSRKGRHSNLRHCPAKMSELKMATDLNFTKLRLYLQVVSNEGKLSSIYIYI
jgi:hypothetical protein